MAGIELEAYYDVESSRMGCKLQNRRVDVIRVSFVLSILYNFRELNKHTDSQQLCEVRWLGSSWTIASLCIKHWLF